ncbi:MAG: large-conductance mechanosensitive channel protein MscL [Thermodesulfobacteriota bacterium]
MWKEFKEFAVKGNVVDMAVGIIIGTAFGAIAKSLVSDIIMPPLGLIISNVDFADIFWVLKSGNPAGPYASVAEAAKAGAVTMNVGVFVNLVINFLLVAFAVFLLVKGVNQLKREQAAPAAPPAPAMKDCPKCLLSIPAAATKCGHCTADLG